MNFKNFRTIYTIFVFVVLAAFDNIVVGLFPPLFTPIAKSLHVHVSYLGAISAVNIMVTCLSSIGWGYFAGKYNRKKLIIGGTIIWSASVYLTSRSQTYSQLFAFQVLTGLGLGCIASIGFSVLTDFIPQKYRGTLLSLWGMSQGLGGIAGALMASLIAPSTSWRRPFEITSAIGFGLIILYAFTKEPTLGAAEPELQGMIKEGGEYKYKIELKHVVEIATKKSNMMLFLQALFFNIVTGTLIWLPTLYNSKIQALGYSPSTAIIASGYLYALFQFGGLTSSYFGFLGDKAQRKSLKGRAYLTALLSIAAIPFYIIMFLLPMKHLWLPDNNNPAFVLVALFQQILFNPWITAMFLLAFVASSAQSANTPNWLALITDVNLPEHRASVFSIANIANGLGRTIGNLAIAYVLDYLSNYIPEPKNYIYTMIIFQFFFIPSAICYLLMTRSIAKDIKAVSDTLHERAKLDKC